MGRFAGDQVDRERAMKARRWYAEMKCPICGGKAVKRQPMDIYRCFDCGWTSP